jgi:5'(3')-deoxyribonucleotidase
MKIKLFLDFDNVIVNSDKIIYEMYKKFYGHLMEDYRGAYCRSLSWDYSKDFPLLFDKNPEAGAEIIKTFYDMDEFFERITITDEDIEALKELNNHLDTYICTLGTQKNISKKLKWIDDNIPFMKNTIGLQLNPFEHGKESVNMTSSIFVDDKKTNLISSNASEKLLYHRGSTNNLYGLIEKIQEECDIKVV